MNILKYLVSVAILLGTIFNVSANKLWDIVLVDISGDMEAYGENGTKEIDIANSALSYLIGNEMVDTIMLFASGRAVLPVDKFAANKHDYSNLLKIIGDGTSINDALASCLNFPLKTGSIMVITNGRENESSISPSTLSKLMSSKGVRVDAIVVSAGCDSIYVKSKSNPTDSILTGRNYVCPGLSHVVSQTKGEIITFEGEIDVNEIDRLCSAVAQRGVGPSNVDFDLDTDLTRKVLARIKPHKINICEVDTNAIITFNGIRYHGLNDILSLAGSEPSILIVPELINGEKRYPLSIVFILDAGEQERKRSKLIEINSDRSGFKLSQDTPIELLPMIYYDGVEEKMLLCGLEFEYPE